MIYDIAINFKNNSKGMTIFESKQYSFVIPQYDSYCVLSISPEYFAVEGNQKVEILKKSDLTREAKLDIKENLKAGLTIGNFMYIGCLE